MIQEMIQKGYRIYYWEKRIPNIRGLIIIRNPDYKHLIFVKTIKYE